MPLKVVKREGSPFWYIRGTVAGERIYESTKTCNAGEADAYRIKIENETWQRRKLGIEKRQPVTFAAAVITYIEHTGQKRFLAPLVQHFRERTIDRIGQAEIDEAAVKLYPNAQPATRLRHVYTPLLAVLNHAASAELAGARLLKVKKPRTVHKPVQWATDEYLDMLLPHCGPSLAAIINFMTETGCRVSEAIRLRSVDLDRVPGFAYVGKTKNGKPRLIPISDALIEQCRAVAPEKPFSLVFGYGWRTSVNTALKRACRRAKLEYLSPHKIGRHAFAARLLGLGKTLKVVKEAGDWQSIAVVDEMYGHLERSHVHKAIKEAAQHRANLVHSKVPARSKV